MNLPLSTAAAPVATDARAGLPSMSGMARVLACPGSVALSCGLRTPEKAWTRDGQLGHEVLAGEVEEEALEGREDLVEQVCRCKQGAAAIRAQLGFDGPEILELPRERLWLHDDAGEPMASGEFDLACLDVARQRALIFDWKLGRNAVAPAPLNPQLIGYALLLAEEYGVTHATLQIVQPWRKPQPAGEIDADGLASWRTALLDALEAAQQPGAARHPGSHCDYCPARTICPEARDVASRVVVVAGGELVPMSLRERWSLMAPAQKLEFWDWLKHAEKTVKETLEFFKEELAVAPDSIPGLRLKAGGEQVRIPGSVDVLTALGLLGLPIEQAMSAASFSLPGLASVKTGGRPGTKKLTRKGEQAKAEIRAQLGEFITVTQKAGSVERV